MLYVYTFSILVPQFLIQIYIISFLQKEIIFCLLKGCHLYICDMDKAGGHYAKHRNAHCALS